MKRKLMVSPKVTLSFILISMIALVVVSSCDKSSDSERLHQFRDEYQNDGLHYSGCKGSGLKSISAGDTCVVLQTAEANYLKVKHFDAVFNCAFDSLKIDFTVDANEIYVKESHINPNMFCTCTYDIEYKIGPLEYGTYTINILDESTGQNEVTVDFEFTENTNVTL